ncbi:hypothetical protein [Paraflavitalea speifideaquila]|uniref:hypothetical protein n=1 Tax=Paraflavitalea speifideaquila TaxID=3076558 RepID=UPI0028EDB281|nr:hypothetical protein [Paraflavitalea speifideiaquila]
MARYYVIVGIALTLASCSSNTPANKTDDDSAAITDKQPTGITKNLPADTISVKQWLTKVIEKYRNSQEKEGFDTLRQALTDDYYHYKRGAIDLEYKDHSTKRQTAH